MSANYQQFYSFGVLFILAPEDYLPETSRQGNLFGIVEWL